MFLAVILDFYVIIVDRSFTKYF